MQRALFLGGLSSHIFEALKSGKTFSPRESVGWKNMIGEIRPLVVGKIEEGKKKGAEYAIGYHDEIHNRSLALEVYDGELFVPYRTFMFFPDPEHSENFALSSFRVKPNYVNQSVPHVVGFLEAYEKPEHALISCLQANFSKKLLERYGDKKYLPQSVEKNYSHWRRIMLRNVIEHYRSQEKEILFAGRHAYHDLNSHETGSGSDRNLVRDMEKLGEAMGFTTRKLSPDELTARRICPELDLHVVEFKRAYA